MSLTRRQLLAASAAGAVAAASAPVTDALADDSPAGLPPGLDLETATVAQLRALLDAGRVSSERLTRAYIDRIRAISARPPSLNAVRALNPAALDEARAADARLRRRGAARPPLLGIPVLVK